MAEEIDTKKCRLAGDMLHIQFTNGKSYVFSLGEIVEQCTGGLTPLALDVAKSPRKPNCGDRDCYECNPPRQ